MTKPVAAKLTAFQSLYQVDRFEPGDPIVAGDLIEDDAPLPHELQPGGAIWDAVRGEAVYYGMDDDDRDRVTSDVLRALAPVLWPLLPSNDRSLQAALASVVRLHDKNLDRARRAEQSRSDLRARHYGLGCLDGLSEGVEVIRQLLTRAGVEL